MEDRYMVFIDGSNLYHAVADRYGKRVDIRKLRDKLTTGGKHIRTYYYTVQPPGHSGEDRFKKHQGFITALRKIPYIDVKFGRLVQRDNTLIEKGVDVALVVDLLSLAFRDAYDVAFLLSGDADFFWAVKAVKSLGKRVILAAVPGRSLADQLREECDEWVQLSGEFLSDCWS